MTVDAWTRIKALFHAALQQPAAERAGWLARTEHDLAVRAEVEALLAAHDDAHDESRAAAGSEHLGGPVPQSPTPNARFDGPGAVIERYRILEEIGEGGFGTVYLAEQTEPVRRRVAFKILKAGMDTRQVIARFEAERQALAMMDHAHIARVFDAGSTVTGRPYFVMELVRGEPITAFCDRRGLDVRRRLQLFLDVCGAIQHAHVKGVVHRDIKPSNVLVTEIDGNATPKVIDFGIAKATDHRLTDRTLFTEQHQVLGTPDYMAPEQAEGSGLDVDTRADVYSLGVLLYELLTGTRPFDFESLLRTGYEAALRHLREVDPPRPSARVGALDAERLATVARGRVLDPGRLRAKLRGDLDHVVMKALRKDRSDRYDTVSGLADDVRRYLEDAPVTAGPPTLRYVLGKALRRHRRIALVAMAILAALLVGLGAALHQADRAGRMATQAASSATLAAEREREARALLTRALDAEATARSALDAERDARRLADGVRMSAQAIALAAESPATALALAIEGAARAPGGDANIALYTALDHHRTLRSVDAHDGRVVALATSPDAPCVLSADDSGLVVLTDADSGRVRARFDSHDAPILAVGFRDAGRAWSADAGGTVRTYAVDAGEERGVVRVDAPLTHLAAAVGSRWLHAATATGGILTIDLDDPAAMPRRTGPPDARAVALHAAAAGRVVAALGDDMAVRVFASGTGEPITAFQLPTDAPPPYFNVDVWYRPSIELDREGRVALVRNRAGHVALHDATDGRLIHQHAGPGRFCGPVALSPDARRVCLLRRDSGLQDPFAEIVDAHRGARIALLHGAPSGERSVSRFAPDGRTIALFDQPHGRTYCAATGSLLGILHGEPYSVDAAAFLHDSRRIAGGGSLGRVHVWSTTAFPTALGVSRRYDRAAQLPVLRLTPDGGRAIVRPDGRSTAERTPLLLVDTTTGATIERLADDVAGDVRAWTDPGGTRHAHSSHRDRSLVVREARTGRVLVRRDDLPVHHLVFCADGAHVAAQTPDEAVVLRCDDGVEIGRVPVAADLPGALSPDGARYAAVDGAAGSITLWDVASRTRLGAIQHRAFSFAAAFTPDGRHLVTTANDTQVLVHEARDLTPVADAEIPTSDYAWLRMAPAGDLAVVVADREALVFELPTLRRAFRWQAARSIAKASFSPTGDTLVAMDHDQHVHRLPLDALAYARAHSPGPLDAAAMARFDVGTAEERRQRRLDTIAALQSARSLAIGALQRLDEDGADAALDLLTTAASLRPRPPWQYHYVRAVALTARGSTPGALPERAAADLAAAVASLGALVGRGGIDAEQVLRAERLAPLRGRADFAAVVERLR